MEDSASRSPRFAEGFELRYEESGDDIENEERVPVLLDLRVRGDRSVVQVNHRINHKKILADPGAERKEKLHFFDEKKILDKRGAAGV